jgi:hypothetical protein
MFIYALIYVSTGEKTTGQQELVDLLMLMYTLSMLCASIDEKATETYPIVNNLKFSMFT